jgi:glyoxylase-like metal-dependent hydrolase (beta-lactamase superfamily II)
VGNSLRVTTTHLKESYLRRNGTPRSDLATLVEVWSRHGDFLTLASMVDDPVYLTEPMVRTTNWAIAPQQTMEPYPCEVGEEVSRAEGDVPHHLPGTNPFLGEYAKRENLPEIATRGGAQTAYPEYMKVLTGKASGALPPATFATVPPANTPRQTDIHVQKVQGSVYMLSSPSGNITIQAGEEGVLLVDAGPAGMSDRVLAEVAKITSLPIRYIVNTAFDPDHTGGNKALFEEGETIAGGDVVNLVGQSSKTGALLVGHENVVLRMTESNAASQALAFGSYPNDSYSAAKKDLFMNGEAIRIEHLPAAHSDGDSVVFFRRSDVLSTGDIFTTIAYPKIDVAAGGTIQGEIDALNQILNIAIPAAKSEGGTYIVPGYGRLSDMADVAYYRDMVTIIRDRILDMKQRGMTLDQVKAARPTRDYDGRWGATTGPWTTDMFVEAVYKTVAAPTTARR